MINERLDYIVKAAMKNDNVVPVELVSEMYTIHNSLFKIKEYNETCSKCRNRVFSNLKLYWLELKSNA